MSTKTTFKRIALVAVAALGFGVLSVAPSQAVAQADAMTVGATAVSGIPGTAATTSVVLNYLSTGTGDTVTATASLLSMPAGNTSLPVFSTTVPTGVTEAGSPVKTAGAQVASAGSVAASTYVNAGFTLSLTSLTAGTYVVKVVSAGGLNTTTVNVTFTLSGAVAGATAASSRVYMRAAALTGSGGFASPANLLGGDYRQVADSTGTITPAQHITNLSAHIAAQDVNASNVATLNVASSTVIGTHVASFAVIKGNGDTITASTIIPAKQVAVVNDNQVACGTGSTNYAPCPDTYFNAAGYPLTYTVSGPGFIKVDANIYGKTFTQTSATDGSINYLQSSFALVSDGTSGVSTITVSQAGTTLKTFTVTQSGAATAMTVVQTRTVYAGTTAPTSPGAQTIVVTVKDKDGNLVADGTTVHAASATTATATLSAASATTVAGVATFTVVGAAAGTSVITFGNAATAATVSTTSTVTVGSSAVGAIVLTTGSPTYMPGSQVVLNGVFNDAAGKAVADGSYIVTATSSLALPVALPSAVATAVVGGKATWTLNAPITEGEFTLTVTVGTISGTATATSENGPATAAANAATDAALEALDAANAAFDAADAALLAADAATAAAQDAADAVAALATSVTEQINALKLQNDNLRKQLVALTNLIIKIQKKVKA